jgi:hypothetical protein
MAYSPREGYHAETPVQLSACLSAPHRTPGLLLARFGRAFCGLSRPRVRCCSRSRGGLRTAGGRRSGFVRFLLEFARFPMSQRLLPWVDAYPLVERTISAEGLSGYQTMLNSRIQMIRPPYHLSVRSPCSRSRKTQVFITNLSAQTLPHSRKSLKRHPVGYDAARSWRPWRSSGMCWPAT